MERWRVDLTSPSILKSLTTFWASHTYCLYLDWYVVRINISQTNWSISKCDIFLGKPHILSLCLDFLLVSTSSQTSWSTPTSLAPHPSQSVTTRYSDWLLGSTYHKLIHFKVWIFFHLKVWHFLASRIFCILRADLFQVITKICASSHYLQNDTSYTHTSCLSFFYTGKIFGE